MKVKIIKARLSDRYIYADQCALERFLQQNNVLKFESALIKDEEAYWSVILYYEEIRRAVNESKNEKYSADTDEELNADEIKILDLLKIWRSEKAKNQNLPVYFIATNRELLSIARYRPAKKEELCSIKGFGKHKVEHYGEEIIEILEEV